MLPLIPLTAGLLVLAIALLTLRSLGPRYRVGRLLASTPDVSIAEARVLAAGPPRYVRVEGRVDSETDFEDDAHRPLVFRRTRLQLRRASAWVDLEASRERVPFQLREGLDSIDLDDEALDAGLIVVVRESEGTAAEVADRVPPGTDPTTLVRLRIEQVSSVDHAIAVGVPGLGVDGAPRMSAGLGRPLILATMERSDAMRTLAEGNPRGPILVAGALVVGFGLVAVGVAWTLIEALA